MKRVRWRYLIYLFMALIVIGVAGGSWYLFKFGFTPVPKTLDHPTTKSGRVLAHNMDWLAHTKTYTWHEISATDHLKLVADYVPAAKPTMRTIVVAHGYMGKKEEMASYIRLFHNQGYNVLAPDDRASGQSQGKYITFGWLDRLDYVKWTQQVVRRLGPRSQIGLFGVSMGGATVMMASGERLPTQVKAIVEDCGYTSVGDELGYELHRLYGLPAFPLLYTANWVAMTQVHFNFLKASAVTQLHHNRLPMFFIHGGADHFVPTKMVYQNYAATRGPKQLWVVPGVGHAESYVQHPQEYAQRVGHFFKQYLRGG